MTDKVDIGRKKEERGSHGDMMTIAFRYQSVKRKLL